MRSRLSFWKLVAGSVVALAVISILTWVTSNPPTLPQLDPCPDDWLYYKKKCYYHSGGRLDWNSSQESCSGYGASLAVIANHQELNFIMYRVRITDFWIGLQRKVNKFFWVNGESFDTNLFYVNITNDRDCPYGFNLHLYLKVLLRNWLCTIGQSNHKLLAGNTWLCKYRDFFHKKFETRIAKVLAVGGPQGQEVLWLGSYPKFSRRGNTGSNSGLMRRR